MRLHKLLLTCVCLIFVSSRLLAQTDTAIKHDTLWHHEMVAGLNFSQIDFSHWEAGGTDALAYIASIAGKSVRNDTNTNWTNTYRLAWGQSKTSGEEIRNTDDEINLESQLTYKFGVSVNPYVDVALLTQFGPGYNYPDSGGAQEVSNFFDPAFIKQSVGMGWMGSKVFQTRLGLALREIVTNKYNQYAADPGDDDVHTTRIEGGLESVSQLDVPVDDNVLFHAKLELFDPFKTLDRVVVHAEASFVAKISKVFSTQLNALFINEPDISPYTQIKEGLSIGIIYAFL
ncbi:MAG TPA: DUF3078 domain-containing protein [Candidatus Kapabacteria bacterium]